MVASGLYYYVTDQDPTALSLLIAAPESPALLLLDDEFLASSYRELSRMVSILSGFHPAICISLIYTTLKEDFRYF
jgi:hypothetical protein